MSRQKGKGRKRLRAWHHGPGEDHRLAYATKRWPPAPPGVTYDGAPLIAKGARKRLRAS